VVATLPKFTPGKLNGKNVPVWCVLKSVAPDLDAEAIRVVQTLKDFRPGRQGGKDVPVWYMVPITFALN
jgi:hypothetical protein